MKIRAAAIAAITLTALFVLAGCASSATSDGGMDNMPGMGASPSASAANVNNSDIQFTMMMIPHHQQAVEMADVILAKDNIDEQVMTLAKQIKAAQGPEIQRMQLWLDEWGTGMGDVTGMGDGMMSDSDMQALKTATGVEASRLFLNQMITHHQGAIQMAQSEVDNGQNPDVISLAQNIITSQTAEIATMKEILATL